MPEFSAMPPGVAGWLARMSVDVALHDHKGKEDQPRTQSLGEKTTPGARQHWQAIARKTNPAKKRLRIPHKHAGPVSAPAIASSRSHPRVCRACDLTTSIKTQGRAAHRMMSVPLQLRVNRSGVRMAMAIATPFHKPFRRQPSSM